MSASRVMGCGGVPTAMMTSSAFSTPSFMEVVKRKRPAPAIAVEKFLQALFIQRKLPGLQGFDFRTLAIHADHVVAQFRQAYACGQTYIAGTDNAYVHINPLPESGRFAFRNREWFSSALRPVESWAPNPIFPEPTRCPGDAARDRRGEERDTRCANTSRFRPTPVPPVPVW